MPYTVLPELRFVSTVISAPVGVFVSSPVTETVASIALDVDPVKILTLSVTDIFNPLNVFGVALALFVKLRATPFCVPPPVGDHVPERFARVPVVRDVDAKSNPVPVVRALGLNTYAEFAPVPVVTPEVNV